MNIAQMMKQAQVMQERMAEMQDRLSDTEVTGSAGGGLVTVVMTCAQTMRKITIDPSVINPNDGETLEDLIIVAVNSAVETGKARMEEETKQMMAGMGLPAGMKLPF
ncbi:MAG: hypothetical protein JWO78_1770 [Micavibrio sp.]|nr:hypothetical protein [Micavibrio sp.]